jgi:amino acid adenylation domain-containing protein/FkbH-like protein
MNDETGSHAKTSPLFLDEVSAQTQRLHHETNSPTDASCTVVIVATFTADPLRAPLQFWMDTLGIPAHVVLSPYGQLLQELLNPASLLSRNANGFDLLLIRVEDWIRDRSDHDAAGNVEHVSGVAREFIAAIGKLRARTAAVMLIYLCPPSSTAPAACELQLAAIHRDLHEQLNALPHTHCFTHVELTRLYPVAAYEDLHSERIGHIPYSQEYFAALASLFARRITVLLKPQYKVIAIDCDNTLWKGVCGEDDAAGVQLTPECLRLQELLVQQHDAGMLLCLCSKNNPEDVAAVFESRPEMPLREQHLICSRVNWNAKSDNLRSLARELDLALDSFIFIDDSALECAEVRAHCPGVLTLQWPGEAGEAAHFIEHVWAFDRVQVTAEARHRTEQYRQNRARNMAIEEATDLQEFLASLRLEIDIAAPQPTQLGRVVELIQRTNQFNLTGIRRRAAELETLLGAHELHCLVVHVRDRFGDYGLVGAVLYASRREESVLEVDTFVLSCRVLGRGVEHRIINELGRSAEDAGLKHLLLRYRHTARNEPARSFLENTFARFRIEQADTERNTYVIPAGSATSTRYQPQEHIATLPTASKSRQASAACIEWHETAFRLSRLPNLISTMSRSVAQSPVRRPAYVAPRTAAESAVAAACAEVLGLERVGMQDEFFSLGGDSLLAVRLIARLAAASHMELPIHELFEQRTIEQIARQLVGAGRSSNAIEPAGRDGPLPLSWSQQRLWFIEQLSGDSSAYHIPLAIRMHGRLAQPALQAALDALVERHESLRTVVAGDAGTPRQHVLAQAQLPLQLVDLRGEADPEHAMLAHSRQELSTPFSLRTGPLIRGLLLRIGDDEHVLLLTMHHMIADGWSLGVFMRELVALYAACSQGLPDPLPPLTIQFADYAQWQTQHGAPALSGQLHYWVEHLRGAPQTLELPTNRPRPVRLSSRGASVEVRLPADLTAQMRDLARQSGVTLAMALYAAWWTLLARLSGQVDIVIGVPVANRPRAELEGLIGFFVNTLPVRVRVDDDPALTDLLQRVKGALLGAYANQDVPLERIVEAMQPTRSLSYNPVFQVVFVLQRAVEPELRVPGLTFTEFDLPLQTAQFDLSLSLREEHGRVCGVLNFATDLFDLATIESWARCFETLVRSMVRHPRLEISRLPWLDAAERLRLVESFNPAPVGYPGDRLIHHLFEEQVRRTPEALAVASDVSALTYAELNARADQIARRLLKAGVRTGDTVGLCVTRSVHMFVGWLAALKAAAAYVPLDPTYPPRRLLDMVADALPRCLLTEVVLQVQLGETPVPLLAIDDECNEEEFADALALQRQCSQDLAYVIYTSGSTGRPKGVMIEHRHVINLWHGLEQLHRDAGPCVRVALNASLSFDASVQQLVQLLSGRSVFVIPEEVRRDPVELLRFLQEHRIDSVDCTPSQLRAWIAAGLLDEGRHPLRLILVGGEAIDEQLWRVLARAPMAVHNVYGPTECAVDATAACVTHDTAAPHIGRPLTNRRVYVLDRHGEPVPPLVAGEIFIGGEGVGRGYLNRPDLTADRFVRDAFSTQPGARAYRTGDLGRWRVDGRLEYLGRNDQQVKIRGFRIELGEIEAQLLKHPAIQQASVVAREDATGQRRLIAYVVPCDAGAACDVEDLRRHLQAVLPEHMQPAAFMTLECMPLTASGKLDRRALPEPPADARGARQYRAPQSEIERVLAEIWQAILRIDRVGRDDSFFRLGGTSLAAMQLQARIQAVLAMDVPIRALFEAPTLEAFAARIQDLRRRRLLEKLARRGIDVNDLVGRFRSMDRREIRQLLHELTVGGTS